MEVFVQSNGLLSTTRQRFIDKRPKRLLFNGRERYNIQMTVYVAFLRAINVGGTVKLPMDHPRAMCVDAGFVSPRTYIASGNVVFASDRSEQEIRKALEQRLEDYTGKAVGVIVRSDVEIAGIVRRNPFADRPSNRVMALFSDAPLPADPLQGAGGVAGEQVRLGDREYFIFYPNGQADTRLRLPSMASGTARNMNTVAKIHALMAAAD